MIEDIGTVKYAEDILEISSALVKCDSLGLDDDLRALGADSLLVVILLQLLKERDITINLSDLGATLTVRSLAEAANASIGQREEIKHHEFIAGMNIYSTLRQGLPNNNYRELFKWNLIGALRFDHLVDFSLFTSYLEAINLEIAHIYIEGINYSKLGSFKLSLSIVEKTFVSNSAELLEHSQQLLKVPSLDRPIALKVIYFSGATYAVIAAHHYYADDYALSLLGRSLATFVLEKRIIGLRTSTGPSIRSKGSASIDSRTIDFGLMPCLPSGRHGYKREKLSVARDSLIRNMDVKFPLDDESLITYAILNSIYGASDNILYERQHSGRNDLKDNYSDLFGFLTDVHPCIVNATSVDALQRTLQHSKESLGDYYHLPIDANAHPSEIIKRFLPTEIHLNIRHDLNVTLPAGVSIHDFGDGLVSEDNYSETLSPVFKYDISVLIHNGVFHVTSYSKANEWLNHRHFYNRAELTISESIT